MKKYSHILTTGLLILIVIALIAVFSRSSGDPIVDGEQTTAEIQAQFEQIGLTTDVTKTLIPLDQILSGGPAKDGIPSIDDPKFISLEEAELADEALGVLVEFEGEKRFYPYSILTWHEIVNDQIGDTPFVVTFCPLCGSAIVFDSRIDGQVIEFGVSGLLYESNLLMYDRLTESLWSQSGTRAVVGDFIGTELEILPMNVITAANVEAFHGDAQVLSRETGYVRPYGTDPYSGYELTEETYFPVSVSDRRFFAKELMYVVPFEGRSIAFPQFQLNGSGTFAFDGYELFAEKLDDGTIRVLIDDVSYPGYFEMWFSWATQNEDDGIVWEPAPAMSLLR